MNEQTTIEVPSEGPPETETARAPRSLRAKIPTALTIARFGAAGLLVGFLALSAPWAPLLAFCLFVTAAVTDFLDGYLARRWQAATALGAALDPIADKVLIAVTLIMLAGTDLLGGLHLIPAAVILGREFLVAGLRESLALTRGRSLPILDIAKWKTSFQFVACLP
ncbi:MAG: CDP-alcohol phosphatidyltransferase family protein, partial [Pseudomonadota bacterium]